MALHHHTAKQKIAIRRRRKLKGTAKSRFVASRTGTKRRKKKK